MQRKEKQAIGVIATTIAKYYKDKYEFIFLNIVYLLCFLKIFMIDIPKIEKKKKSIELVFQKKTSRIISYQAQQDMLL
jgi:hypothetical protein